MQMVVILHWTLKNYLTSWFCWLKHDRIHWKLDPSRTSHWCSWNDPPTFRILSFWHYATIRHLSSPCQWSPQPQRCVMMRARDVTPTNLAPCPPCNAATADPPERRGARAPDNAGRRNNILLPFPIRHCANKSLQAKRFSLYFSTLQTFCLYPFRSGHAAIAS